MFTQGSRMLLYFEGLDSIPWHCFQGSSMLMHVPEFPLSGWKILSYLHIAHFICSSARGHLCYFHLWVTVMLPSILAGTHKPVLWTYTFHTSGFKTFFQKYWTPNIHGHFFLLLLLKHQAATVCIVLTLSCGILHSLRVKCTHRKVCEGYLCVRTVPFYVRNLNILEFWYLKEVLKPIP